MPNMDLGNIASSAFTKSGSYSLPSIGVQYTSWPVAAGRAAAVGSVAATRAAAAQARPTPALLLLLRVQQHKTPASSRRSAAMARGLSSWDVALKVAANGGVPMLLLLAYALWRPTLLLLAFALWLLFVSSSQLYRVRRVPC